MKRQLIDGGGWFNIDTATKYEESSYHDGNNFISEVTGSQWEHEALYRTRKGVYIINHWSQWQGSRETWRRVDAREAAEWLVMNGRDVGDDDKALAEARDEAEV